MLAVYNIWLSLTKCSIDPKRVVIWQVLPPDQDLRRVSGSVDVTADSRDGYSLHSTASCHLAADIPVLTRRGDTFVRNVCASILMSS